VNAVWDLAPHDVSIFNYLLNGKPSWVSAVGGNVLQNCRQDVGFVSLGYPNGVVGHIHVSWADPSKVREVVVVGSNCRILFDDVKTGEQVRIYEKGVSCEDVEASNYGEFRFLIHDGDIISPMIETSEPLKEQCTHFLECVVQSKRPLTDGQAGLEVVQVMEAVDRSIEQGGAPVKIE
jgi:predicted dehydrogenase